MLVTPVQLTCHAIELDVVVKFTNDSLTMDAFSEASTSKPLLIKAVSKAVRSYTNHHRLIAVLTVRLVASMSPVVDEVASTTSTSKK